MHTAYISFCLESISLLHIKYKFVILPVGACKLYENWVVYTIQLYLNVKNYDTICIIYKEQEATINVGFNIKLKSLVLTCTTKNVYSKIATQLSEKNSQPLNHERKIVNPTVSLSTS